MKRQESAMGKGAVLYLKPLLFCGESSDEIMEIRPHDWSSWLAGNRTVTECREIRSPASARRDESSSVRVRKEEFRTPVREKFRNLFLSETEVFSVVQKKVHLTLSDFL